MITKNKLQNIQNALVYKGFFAFIYQRPVGSSVIKSKNVLFPKILNGTLLILMAVLLSADLKSQKFMEPLGKGCPIAPNGKCMDDSGNLYVAEFSDKNHIEIYKWNGVSWDKYNSIAQVNVDFITSYNIHLAFVNSKLYLAANISGSPIKTYIYKLDQSATSLIGTSNDSRSTKQLLKVGNKLLYSGHYDSVGNIKAKNVAYYTGASWKAAKSDTGFTCVDLKVSEKSDTVFGVSSKDHYIYFNTKDTIWGVYNNKRIYYNRIECDRKRIIALDADSFYTIAFGGQIKKALKKGVGLNELRAHNQYLVGIYDTPDTYVFTVIKNGVENRIYESKNIFDVERNVFYSDSTALYMTSYFGNINYKGSDYGYISKINLDSAKVYSYDTICGYVYYDRNGNFKKDNTDSGILARVFGTAITGSFFTNSQGYYQIVVPDFNNYDLEVSDFNFDTCLHTPFNGALRSANTRSGITLDSLNFPLTRLTTYTKNLILKNQSGYRARLLDTIPLTVNIRNLDCASVNTTNGVVKITLDAKTNLVASIPAFSSKSGNEYTFSNLTFDYTQDNPIQLFVVYSNINYSVGQMVRHYARLGNINGEDTTDNSDSIVQELVYSYDPNVKHSLPEGKITRELKSIRYYIDFQNEGNDDARRVTIVDTLNLKMPVYEFRMIAASHPYTVSLKPGTSVVTWVFDNINLKPKSMNEEASKGYLIFDAKVRGDLRIGDSIRNRAYIYFDYNEPVITNFAVISMVDDKDNLDNVNTMKQSSFKVYPNPAGDYTQIENKSASPQFFTIYDFKGAKVWSAQLNGLEKMRILTAKWAAGLYLIEGSNGECLKIIIE